jgi:GDP-4-dehydro-6-deoxy-D-mannose reductase
VRAFVTGGQGFVGPWLCQYLAAAGDDVVSVDLAVDVTDRAKVQEAIAEARPDAVYHLAAQSSVKASWDDPAATFGVNVLGTVNVLDAVRACRPAARVLLISSVEVYGLVPPDEQPVVETAPFRPATPYAASKAGAELAGLQAHLGSGLDVVRARPFNHTGPGQTARFFVSSMARQIVEAGHTGASELKVGNLGVARDFLDVRDVVRAYRLLIERGTAGQVYNICSGRSVTLHRVLQRLLDLAGSDLRVTADPSRMRPVDLPDLRGDPAQMAAATGWAPEYTLDQTLADVLAHWRRHLAPPAG